MTEQELSKLLSSITGIRKGFLESPRSHIERCYEEMVFQMTSLKRGFMESLKHYIIRGLAAYAVNSGLTKKKFLKSDGHYESRCYELLAANYSANNDEDLLINVYSNKAAWATYSKFANAKANSDYPTLEVTYHGQKRLVEIIKAGQVRTGDIIRGHRDGYDSFKFSRVTVGSRYIDHKDDPIVEILFEDGVWYKISIYDEYQRIIL